jgi:hypothetical protein
MTVMFGNEHLDLPARHLMVKKTGRQYRALRKRGLKGFARYFFGEQESRLAAWV